VLTKVKKGMSGRRGDRRTNGEGVLLKGTYRNVELNVSHRMCAFLLLYVHYTGRNNLKI